MDLPEKGSPILRIAEKEAAKRLLELLDRTYLGETILVTREDEVIAEISPVID